MYCQRLVALLRFPPKGRSYATFVWPAIKLRYRKPLASKGLRLVELSLLTLGVSTFSGCSMLLMSTGGSDLGEIRPGLTKTEIQERLGPAASTGTTTAGRQTENYKIAPIEKQIDKRDVVKFVVLCGIPTSWGLCAAYMAFDTLVFPFVYREREANKIEVLFVYGEDERVLFYYQTRDEPGLRFHQALAPLPHPFSSPGQATCARLKPCLLAHIEETRTRAEEVGYVLTPEDEEEFRQDLEVAERIDNGEITLEEAYREKYRKDKMEQQPGSACHDQRKTSLPHVAYVHLHKLTEQLLSDIGERGSDMQSAVLRYAVAFRQRATASSFPLICSDDEKFTRELEIAKDADDGILTREQAVRSLELLTTEHLLNLYFGRP
jgi:hypothetical protein